MNLLLFTLTGRAAISAVAQQPVPEGNNSNRNSPIVNTPATAPTRAQFDGQTYHANQVTVMRTTSAEQ